MNDTATFPVHTLLSVPTLFTHAAPIALAEWRCEAFDSLGEAEDRLDELAVRGRERRLIISGPGRYDVEWR